MFLHTEEFSDWGYLGKLQEDTILCCGIVSTTVLPFCSYIVTEIERETVLKNSHCTNHIGNHNHH